MVIGSKRVIKGIIILGAVVLLGVACTIFVISDTQKEIPEVTWQEDVLAAETATTPPTPIATPTPITTPDPTRTPRAAKFNKPKPKVTGQALGASQMPVSQDTIQIYDDFNGGSLDASLWQVMRYPKGYRNNEEQEYVPEQVSVRDGALRITASKDSNGWRSGEVHSKWGYKYGEFEVRMAVSARGQGVWPAAWLMNEAGNWPAGGEIDIMENINGSTTVHGTIHGGGSSGHWMLQKSHNNIDVTKYHTYKIIKQPGVMSWWVDGIKRGEWRQSDIPKGAVWPFEENANIALLNLAIGGNWPGPSDATTPSSITMSVDYFSVKNAR